MFSFVLLKGVKQWSSDMHLSSVISDSMRAGSILSQAAAGIRDDSTLHPLSGDPPTVGDQHTLLDEGSSHPKFDHTVSLLTTLILQYQDKMFEFSLGLITRALLGLLINWWCMMFLSTAPYPNWAYLSDSRA